MESNLLPPDGSAFARSPFHIFQYTSVMWLVPVPPHPLSLDDSSLFNFQPCIVYQSAIPKKGTAFLVGAGMCTMAPHEHINNAPENGFCGIRFE